MDDYNNSAYSSSSSLSDGYDNDELIDYNEMEDRCVTDMRGCRILRMENIAKAIQDQMYFKKCTISKSRV